MIVVGLLLVIISALAEGRLQRLRTSTRPPRTRVS